MTKTILVIIIILGIIGCYPDEKPRTNHEITVVVSSTNSAATADIKMEIRTFHTPEFYLQELPFVYTYEYSAPTSNSKEINCEALSIDHNTDITIEVVWNEVIVTNETMPAIVGEHTVIKTEYIE